MTPQDQTSATAPSYPLWLRTYNKNESINLRNIATAQNKPSKYSIFNSKTNYDYLWCHIVRSPACCPQEANSLNTRHKITTRVIILLSIFINVKGGRQKRKFTLQLISYLFRQRTKAKIWNLQISLRIQ